MTPVLHIVEIENVSIRSIELQYGLDSRCYALASAATVTIEAIPLRFV